MIALTSLLASLSGQFMSTGEAFNFAQLWVVNPEQVAQPRMPSVYHAWDKSKEPVFAYRKMDIGTYGDTTFQDTVVLTWNGATGDYEEIHRASSGDFFGKAQKRIVIRGLDSVRAKHGAAVATTVFNWERDTPDQPWGFRASIEGRDSATGRVFLYKSLGGFVGGDDTVISRIWENYDAQGFVVCREQAGLQGGEWITSSKDSMERGPDGMPVKSFVYTMGFSGQLELFQQQTYAWSGRNLQRNTIVDYSEDPAATIVQQYGWNPQGRLVSGVSDLPGSASYRFEYDAQGNVSSHDNRMNRYRYVRDASGRIVSVRTDVAQGFDESEGWRIMKLDSFQYAPNGRMTERRQYTSSTTDSTMDLSSYALTVYSYDVQVPVREKSVRHAAGRLRRMDGKWVGTGIPGRRVVLRIVRPDGRQELSSEGIGEAAIRADRLAGGLAMWTLEVDGEPFGGGSVMLPGR